MAEEKQAKAAPAPKPAEPAATSGTDLPGLGDEGQAELQAMADTVEAQGFAGTEVDPTPNENYTLQGVASGAPTPETDAEAKAAAEQARRDVAANQ